MYSQQPPQNPQYVAQQNTQYLQTQQYRQDNAINTNVAGIRESAGRGAASKAATKATAYGGSEAGSLIGGAVGKLTIFKCGRKWEGAPGGGTIGIIISFLSSKNGNHSTTDYYVLQVHQ